MMKSFPIEPDWRYYIIEKSEEKGTVAKMKSTKRQMRGRELAQLIQANEKKEIKRTKVTSRFVQV